MNRTLGPSTPNWHEPHIQRVACLLFCFIGCLVAHDRIYSQESPGRVKLESWQLHEKLSAQSRFKDLNWHAMGPKFAGGRIESVDAPRGDLSTIYAGVGAGGIWKTTNGGLTWQPIFENQSTFAIGDLTLAPSDPNVIWVGTGECHLSRSSYSGTGVFKSTDAGKTWQNMGLHDSGQISKVIVHPTRPDIVWVASLGRKRGGGQRGVYKTTNGGKTFKQVLVINNRVGIVDLVMDPNNPKRLYAAAWDRGGQQSGIYRSDDSGENWKRLAGGLLEKTADRIAIDVAKNKPGVIYALVADRSSPNLARRRNASILFRSDDYGETWKRTHENYVPTYVGWDFCDLRVAPDDENFVYIGGLRLITSSDGGKTFDGEGGFAINRKKDEVFRLHAHRGIGMHLDVHDIWIDPVYPDRVMLGNDGGLFISHDRAKTWLHLNNLPIAEFYKIHLDNEKPFRIWGGTQDNASFVGPASARYEAGEDDRWKHVFLDPWTGGDGFATFPDPNDPEITYYTQQNGLLQRSKLGRLRSIKRIQPRADRGKPALRFSWDTPFFASSHQGPTVLYSAAQRVFRSTNRGDQWVAISPDLTRNGLLALSESPIDPNRLVAGGGRGEIHLTEDGGKKWKAGSNGLAKKIVRDIAASHHSKDSVYVVLSGKDDSDWASYVYKSDDFGNNWKTIHANLPPEPANAIAEHPNHDGLLFLGTDLGVYVSLDDGKKWHSLCQTLPTAPVVDIAIQARDNKVVAATHGLSLFILDIQPIVDAK